MAFLLENQAKLSNIFTEINQCFDRILSLVFYWYCVTGTLCFYFITHGQGLKSLGL